MKSIKDIICCCVALVLLSSNSSAQDFEFKAGLPE